MDSQDTNINKSYHKIIHHVHIRKSVRPEFPGCVKFTNVSDQVSEKLESTKDVPEDVSGDLVFHMFLPAINQTVVKTVQSAGLFVHRVSRESPPPPPPRPPPPPPPPPRPPCPRPPPVTSPHYR